MNTNHPLRSMLHGQLDAKTRHEAQRLLASISEAEREHLISDAFQPPEAPDVFDAAFSLAHSRRGQHGWSWWALATTAFISAGLLWLHVSHDDTRIKAVEDHASLEAGLVVLVSEGGKVRRALPDEAVGAQALLLFRVTLPRAGFVGLEVRRAHGPWVREWPSSPRGTRVEVGEHELGDSEGALAVRVGEGELAVRLVGAARPLDSTQQITVGVSQAVRGQR